MNKIRLAYLSVAEAISLRPSNMNLDEVRQHTFGIGMLKLPTWYHKGYLFYFSNRLFFSSMPNGELVSANQRFWVHDYESQ